MTWPWDEGPPVALYIPTGWNFRHGHADETVPPCDTGYPSLWCTCGACQLLWGCHSSGPPAGHWRRTAVVSVQTFVHAACPQDGSGPQCTTARGARRCTCGQYALVWDPIEEEGV